MHRFSLFTTAFLPMKLYVFTAMEIHSFRFLPRNFLEKIKPPIVSMHRLSINFTAFSPSFKKFYVLLSSKCLRPPYGVWRNIGTPISATTLQSNKNRVFLSKIVRVVVKLYTLARLPAGWGKVAILNCATMKYVSTL